MPKAPPPPVVEVIAPNFKRRLSGVTATVVRLVPELAREIGVVTTGPGLPDRLPHLPLWRVACLPNDRWRVWHARRNLEMLAGLVLRHVLRRRLRLLFTSADQRPRGAYTHWLMRRMDGLVATSPAVSPYLPYPHEVVMHGVDTALFRLAPDRAALRRRLGLPEGGVILGSFGRIRAEKGVDLVVEAALRLMPARPELHLIFAGRVKPRDRAFHAGLVARIAEAGLSGRIRFLGEVPLDAVAELYQALDLYVAAGWREGFGLTPLEAMASGVPVVATRVGAYADVITPATGSLVDPGDQGALTEALAAWIDDPARRAAAGTRAHVLAHHALAGEAAALAQLYRRLIATGGPLGAGN
jgi:mannosyltransferase